MKNVISEVMYRFQVKVPNVYEYMMVIKPSISELASYKNEVSGFVKESEVWALKEFFTGRGISLESIRLIESKEYWKNYDKYQNWGGVWK